SAVGEQALGAVPEFLDVAEDVVPAPAVQSRRMITQLPQDLVGLERRQDGLDQHGRADRAAADAERVLRGVEHVVPESRLEVTLELRQIEVRAAALRADRGLAMNDCETEVQSRRHS